MKAVGSNTIAKPCCPAFFSVTLALDGGFVLMTFAKYLVAVAAVGVLSGSGAMAQDASLYFDPQLHPTLTAPHYFEGFYAGMLSGVSSARHGNFLTPDNAPPRIDITAVGGWNEAIAPRNDATIWGANGT